MKNFVKTTVAAACIGLTINPVFADDDNQRGIIEHSDYSFSYQGYLEFEGAPANGDYYFRLSLFDTQMDMIDSLYAPAGPITVTDGLFVIERIQMGGTITDAKQFWRRYGSLIKFMKIEVGEIEGNYTELNPMVELGTSPHSIFSSYTQSLTFPYVDSHFGTDQADRETMITLTNELGGTLIHLNVDTTSSSPLLELNGATTSGSDFNTQNGALRIDALDERVGILSIAKEFPIAGIIPSPNASSTAAVFGEIGQGVEGIGVWALNLGSGTGAVMAGPDFAGDFDGNILARNNLRVQGEPTRDFASDNPSPIGPLAYGSVASNGSLNSGTANMSSIWDAANSRYEITIANESISFANTSSHVTVVDSFVPRVATINTVSGKVHVTIWDLNSGNIKVQDNFQIVIYDPTATTLHRAAAPNGVDEDAYSQKTGSSLITTRPRHEPVDPFEKYGPGITSQN